MKRVLAVCLLVLCIPSLAWAECYSDFDCGMGNTCVKAPYQSSGTCMKRVDRHGLQRFDLPSLDSVGPKMDADCYFDTDCPVGFHCHPKYKACVKR
jgi:hypothetical protein